MAEKKKVKKPAPKSNGSAKAQAAKGSAAKKRSTTTKPSKGTAGKKAARAQPSKRSGKSPAKKASESSAKKPSKSPAAKAPKSEKPEKRSGASRKWKKLGIVFGVLLFLVVLAVAAMGTTYAVTGVIPGQENTINVTYDGTTYTEDSGGIYLLPKREIVIETVPEKYKVKILANASKTDFGFALGGEEFRWKDMNGRDFSEGFGIEQTESGIKLNYETVAGIIAAVQGTAVSLSEEEEPKGDLFTLVVSCGLKELKIGFGVALPANGIVLDPPDVIFGNEIPSDKYRIEYIASGDATNLSDLRIEGAEEADIGETITFQVTIGDSNYSVTGIRIVVQNVTGNLEYTERNGVYTFVMPQGNVGVWVDFKYTPPIEKEMIAIEYDTLGNGSLDSVNIECAYKAAAGDKVMFQVTLRDPSLQITRIVVQDTESGDQIYSLGKGEGSFSFDMPEYPVTVLFYLM